MPMIRGKAFEFSARDMLAAQLSLEKWKVEKINQNAQSSVHDEDIKVTNLESGNSLSIECKLAGKGSFRIHKKSGIKFLRVKCMRSRTLGTKMVAKLAPQLGVSVDQLSTHNDQYRQDNFDIVITTIANAFYETDEDGNYYWFPGDSGKLFLQRVTGCTTDAELQEAVFNKLYFAKTSDLIITPSTHIVCTRKKCTNKTDCQFIPNFPVIIFDEETLKPTNNWYELDKAEQIFVKMT